MKLLRVFISALIILSAFAGEAKAQFFLEEGKKVLEVSGGDRLNGSLIIHNTSKEPQDVRVYWEDFAYQPPYDGTKKFLPAGSQPDSAAQWVSFSPQVFSLPSFGQQKVDYTFSIPQNIQGGHYGVLFFEKTSRFTQDQNGVNLVTRVGCLFFIEPAGKIKKASLENIQLVSGKELKGQLLNEGDVILTPQTTYYLMQKEGLVLDRGKIRDLYIPPGAAASWDISLPSLKPGQYSLVINADLGEGDVTVQEVDLTKHASGRLSMEPPH